MRTCGFGRNYKGDRLVFQTASVRRCRRQVEVAVDFAAAAMRAGDLAEAQRLLREALVHDPRNASALDKLAKIAIDENRIEEATILLRRAAEADPRSSAVSPLPAIFRNMPVRQRRSKSSSNLRRQFARHSSGGRWKPSFRASSANTTGRSQSTREWRTQRRQTALWMSLGNALKTVGRTDEAVAPVRRAISFGRPMAKPIGRSPISSRSVSPTKIFRRFGAR